MSDVETRDSFVVLGLPHRFDVDLSMVEDQANSRIGLGLDPARIAEARRVIVDPIERAAHLLELMGGAYHVDDTVLPAGFREFISILHTDIAEAQNDPAELSKIEQRLRVHRKAYQERIGILFRQLSGHDNPVVQRDRRRHVRAQINAMRMLEELDDFLAEIERIEQTNG